MNTQVGRSAGIALLLAAALLAALFAMGVFAPVGTSAHAPTFENLNIDILADADGDGTITATELISATNNPDGVNDAYEWVIPENATGESFNLVSTGHEGATYSIDSDAITALYSINASTGVLTYNGTGLDYEDSTEVSDLAPNTANPPFEVLQGKQIIRITVTATVPDAGTVHEDPDTATVTVNVTVTDEDDSPEFGAAPAPTIRENSNMARNIGSVTATDEDNDNVDISFSLDDASMAAGFSLGTATGGAGDPQTPRTAMISYARPEGAEKLNYESYTDPTKAIQIMVTAMSGSGSAMQTVTIGVTDQGGEKPGKPNAPTLTHVKDTSPSSRANGTELLVSWDAPANEGPDIFQYSLEYKKETASSWITATTNVYNEDGKIVADGAADPDGDGTNNNPTPGVEDAAGNQANATGENFLSGTSATIKGLDKGVNYVARVKAQSLEGTSTVSDDSAALAPTVSPGKPTGLMLTAGNGSLSASWTAPQEDGGLPLTYKVIWRTIGQQEADGFVESGITDTSFDIPGLQNGTRYTVTVTASNTVGESASSDAKSATPMAAVTAPSIPTNLTLENPTTTSVLVRWNAPASNGGQAITGYEGQITLANIGAGNPTAFTAGPSVTSRVINFASSTSVRTITVMVRAINAQGTAGQGDWDTTQTEIPAAPAAPRVLDNELPKTIEAVSSDIPGTAVRVEAMAKLGKGLGQKIDIKLAKFGLPSSIDDDDVTIQTNDGTSYFSGNPRDVITSGSTVTLWLGSLKQEGGTGTMNTLDATKVTTIIIQQSAGITNPNVAKVYPIEVDTNKTTNKATVNEKVSVKPASGSRGDEITVTGKGFGTGTASVQVGGETVLSSVAITDGSFETTLAVGDEFVAGANTINAIDSSGNEAAKGDTATFTLKPKVTATPSEAGRETKVTLKVSDWGKSDITSVNFGGIGVSKTGTISGGKGEIEITVPSKARLGINKVTVKGGDSEGSVNVTVKGLDLSISPSTVVPGQQITISGSGFAKSKDKDDFTITIGGKDVTPPSDAATTSTGRVSVTVAVPLNVGSGDMDVELMVESRTGEGEITVAKPSVTVSPDTSAPGTTVTVSGSGFASGERLEIFYDGGFEEVGRADSNGDFSTRLEIPSDAGIGATNKVKVWVRNQHSIVAEADHKTPGAMITLPAQAQTGSNITITGSSFESFSTLSKVSIGGKNAMPSPAPETDKNGAFSLQVRVPRLGAGSHNVTIEDSASPKNTATETFTVVTTAVVNTPEEVFGVLGDSLVSVWSLDNATKEWSAYFPGAPEAVNDLTGVSSGDIVWINVSADVVFQGGMLTTGWNLISLE